MLYIDIFLPFFNSYGMAPCCFRPRLLRASLRSNEKREKHNACYTGCNVLLSSRVPPSKTTTTATTATEK